MRGFVANTDYDWFTFLRAIEPPIDEVNFWQPKSQRPPVRLLSGNPFLFRLKKPRYAIAGFGFFSITPHRPDGDEPRRLIIPIGSVKSIEISAPDPAQPFGFAVAE